MKFLVLFVFSAVLLFAQGAPTKRFLIASTKDLGANLVRVPVAPVVRKKCEEREEREESEESEVSEEGPTPSEEGPTPSDESPTPSDESPTPSDESPTPSEESPTTIPPVTTTTVEPTRTTTLAPTTTTRTLPPTTTSVPDMTTATMPSSGGAPSGGGPPAGTGTCVSCAVDNFNTVNSYRESVGLSKLGWSDTLAGLSEGWSKTMYDSRVFKHSDYNYWENIIWGYGQYSWDTVSDGFFEGWRTSEGHDENMRLSTHECMGVGIYGDGDKFYGTQIFSNDCP